MSGEAPSSAAEPQLYNEVDNAFNTYNMQLPPNMPIDVNATTDLTGQEVTPILTGAAEEDITNRQNTLGDTLKFGIPGLAAAAVDTVGRSVGLFNPNTVSNFLNGLNTNLGDYYQRNKQPLSMTSDLLTFLIPGTLGAKAIQTGSWLFKGLEAANTFDKFPAVAKLFASAGDASELTAAVRNYDLTAATTQRTIDFVSRDPIRSQLIATAMKTGVSDSIKKYVASEAAIYLTMNQSDTFYPKDMKLTDWLMMHSIGMAGSVGIESLFLRSAIRKSLQRPEIMDAMSKSVNALGLPVTVSMPGERDLASTAAAMSAAEQRYTVRTATDATLKTNANRYATAWDGQAKTAVEAMQKDGLPGIVAPNRKNAAGVETIMNALQTNPAATMGVHTFVEMPSTPDAFDAAMNKLSNTANGIDEYLQRMSTKTNLSDDEITRIDKLTKQRDLYRSLRTVVIDANGDVHQPENVGLTFQDLANPPRISKTADVTAEPGYYSVKVKDPYTKQMFEAGINADLLPLYPTGQKWIDMSRFQQSTYYAVGQKWIANYKPGRLASNIIQVGENEDPFRLGLIRSVLQKQPNALSDFQFPLAARGNEMQWLEDQWLQQSYNKTFVPMMDRFNAQGAKTFLNFKNLHIKLDDIRYALNMPASFLHDQHPAFKLFRSLYTQGDDKIQDALSSMSHFQGMMKEEQLPIDASARAENNSLTPDEFGFLKSGKMSPFGTNFAYPTNAAGDFMPAQVAFIKPLKWDLTKTSMTEAAVAQKTEFLGKFANAPGPIKELSNFIFNSAAYPVSKQVDTLGEGMQASRGYLVQQNMATRDLNVFTALDMIAKHAENVNRTAQRALWDTHKEAFLGLQGDENAMFHFAQFAQARRYGFDLEDEASPLDGMYRFRLKRAGDEDKGDFSHTARNIAAWKRAFGPDAELPDASEETFLPDIIASGKDIAAGRSYTPLAINETAYNGVAAFRDISDQLFDMGNFFRTLYGRSPLTYQSWHIPPQNLSNKFVKYIINPAEEGGNSVKTIITGNTAAELERKMQKPAIQALMRKGNSAIDASNEGELTGIVLDQNDIRNYFDLHDDAFFHMHDMTDGLAQTGPTRGVTATPLLEYGHQVLNDMIKSVENQLTMYTRRTSASIFKDEINYARMADGASQVAASRPKGVKGISIWQQYYHRLIGTPTESPKESVINAEVPLINNLWAKASDTIHSMMPRRGTDGSVLEAKDYNRLKKIYGDKLPFSSAEDFIANTFKVRAPKTFESFSGALNAITANTVMRFMEFGNGIVSLAGNLVAMPLVMNSLKRQSWDTDQSWQARTGFMGGFTGKDGTFAAPNMVRMMAKSISFLFTKEGQQMIDEAKLAGNIKPMMAEGYKTLHAPFEGPLKKSLNKFIDAMSIMSDKGEEWSRIWAYSAGYQIAKLNGLSNKYDMHNIANLFADNVIADYRTVNKPMAFQGALAAPLGLFQTYMYNYYGRLFRYIENKDWRGLALNYAMQSSIFGVQSVPGWQQFQSLHSFAYNGRHDLVDNLDNAYGHSMADLLLYGSLSNIPRLFSKDGIALYSRGDVNLTHVPAYISPENAPVFRIAGNTYDLISALFDQLRTGGQLNVQKTLETIGTYSINRPIGRLFELMAGVSADKRGNLINDDTRSVMSVVSRIMGMRPLIEQKNMQTLARLNTTREYQEAINNRTESTLRSLFRSNVSAETLQNGMAKAISDHLAYGGSPYSIADFIRNAAISAELTKTTGTLKKLLGEPGRVNDLIRLINSMNDFDDGSEG